MIVVSFMSYSCGNDEELFSYHSQESIFTKRYSVFITTILNIILYDKNKGLDKGITFLVLSYRFLLPKLEFLLPKGAINLTKITEKLESCCRKSLESCNQFDDHYLTVAKI